MKIVDRKTFLTLPPGTFFAKGIKWYIDGFCVKKESYENDFTYYNLVGFDWEAGIDASDLCDKMIENGESRQINKRCIRDWCFADEDVFLIFEENDLIYIKKRIEEYSTGTWMGLPVRLRRRLRFDP